MRREIAFLITIALSSVAFSKEPVDRSVRAPAQGTEMALIAPGVLEHVNEKGENVRIFQGAEGLNVLLSEKRLELRKLIEAEGEEAASGLRKLVADLEVSASFVEPLGASGYQSKSTLSQTIGLNPYIPQICHKRLYPSAKFQVTFGMVNYPVVTGEFPPFGWGSQVGPPAPMPDSTFRSVYVKLDHRTDYHSSSEASTHLQGL